jgi:hypothetical protein
MMDSEEQDSVGREDPREFVNRGGIVRVWQRETAQDDVKRFGRDR